jgi:hypothetical protein
VRVTVAPLSTVKDEGSITGAVKAGLTTKYSVGVAAVAGALELSFTVAQ